MSNFSIITITKEYHHHHHRYNDHNDRHFENGIHLIIIFDCIVWGNGPIDKWPQHTKASKFVCVCVIRIDQSLNNNNKITLYFNSIWHATSCYWLSSTPLLWWLLIIIINNILIIAVSREIAKKKIQLIVLNFCPEHPITPEIMMFL